MRWTKEQIREARQQPLPPLLLSLGHGLRGLPQENYRVEGMEGLILKRHYWRWPERNLEGNAIDFLVKVQGMTFHQAMLTLTALRPPPF